MVTFKLALVYYQIWKAGVRSNVQKSLQVKTLVAVQHEVLIIWLGNLHTCQDVMWPWIHRIVTMCLINIIWVQTKLTSTPNSLLPPFNAHLKVKVNTHGRQPILLTANTSVVSNYLVNRHLQGINNRHSHYIWWHKTQVCPCQNKGQKIPPLSKFTFCVRVRLITEVGYDRTQVWSFRGLYSVMEIITVNFILQRCL